MEEQTNIEGDTSGDDWGSDISIRRVPAASKLYHPSDSINRFLLEQTPSADVAVTHDSQWIDVFSEGCPHHESQVIERICARFEPVSDGGAVYLRPREQDLAVQLPVNSAMHQQLSARGAPLPFEQLRTDPAVVGETGPGRHPLEGDTEGNKKPKSSKSNDKSRNTQDPLDAKAIFLRDRNWKSSERDYSPKASLDWEDQMDVSPPSQQQRHLPEHLSMMIRPSKNPPEMQQGDGNDLDEAIQHHRAALQLTPAGHPDRSASLNNLANALSTRFEQRGDGNDVDEAIQHHRAALQLRPAGHPDRSDSLNNLANTLLMRFSQRGDGKDLDEAIQLASTAAEQSLARPTHLRAHTILAKIHLTRWQNRYTMWNLDDRMRDLDDRMRDLDDRMRGLDDAMDHYRLAAQCAPAGLLQRLKVSLQWVKDAQEHHHTSALDAYALSLQLLDSHISATTSISSRHEAWKKFPLDLSVNAASCALRQGDVCRAVELLEQGRALHWAQIVRFRTSLDDLRSRDPLAEVLVKRFRDLSAMLNRPAQTSLDEGRSITTVEDEAQRYRGLVEEWNKVVEEIRTFEGFSRFLLPPLFADLREAAREGPIIILIASKFSCDAIIVWHTRSPVHLRLPLKEIGDLVVKHLKNIHHVHGNDDTFKEVMDELWRHVIHPVVRELKRFARKDSRVWWCPTSHFTALPLHSAGYGSLSRLFISSYTPTLLALIKARTKTKTTSDIKFAAIGQAAPEASLVSFPRLHYVDSELNQIEQRLPIPPILFTKLTSSESTKQQALRTLQDHEWFHLSCHGKQDHREPFKSHFAMRDGPLSLLDIIDADTSGHEFAFLSACETAMGDLSSPDE
ncbi:hypothetical protein HYDPIDRAFT_34865, partial [Hydnomerulius pinastri MD-312]